MAIVYSYPLNKNILSTDIIVGTTTATVSGTGRPKNQTKSFQVIDLAGYINSFNTLDTVLHNGNTSLLDAKIGELGLYDPTEQDYAKLNINDSEFNFYNATGSIISVLTKDTLSLYANSYIGNLLVPNTITANRSYIFPNQSGTVALLSDIPSLTGFVPYTGATTTVNLGSQNIFANEMLANELFLFDTSYATYGSVFLQAEGFYVKNNATTLLANINPGEMALLGFGPGGDWQAKFTYSTLSANRVYALPNASGTIALTSNLSGYIPYTGATGAVDLGAYNLTVNSISVGKGAGTGVNNTAVGNLALSSNTTGNYNSAFGSSALSGNTSGSYNVGVGYISLSSNTNGNFNTAIGHQSLRTNTSGAVNVSIGANSMFSNTNGSSNTAVGVTALQANTSANFNSAFGHSALYSNINGGSNTGVGQGSLYTNTSGSSNTAVGRNSLYQNTLGESNVAIGLNTLFSNTTGSNNIAIGNSALLNTTTGSDNTAVGGNAISNNTTGIQNVGLGKFSSLLNATDSNCIVIGFNAIGAGSNTVTLGNVSTTTTRLRGTVQGGSFVKDGGTASQYLMANGSVTTSGPLFKSSAGLQGASGINSTILGPITSSMFTDGDILKIQTMVTFAAQTINVTPVSYYINTSPSLTGATQIATFDVSISQRYSWMDRSFWAYQGLFNARNFGNSSQTSLSNSGAAPGSTSIPATFYIIVTATTGAGDLVALSSILVEKI